MYRQKNPVYFHHDSTSDSARNAVIIVLAVILLFPSLLFAQKEEIHQLKSIMKKARQCLYAKPRQLECALEYYSQLGNWYNENKQYQAKLDLLGPIGQWDLCEGVGLAYALNKLYYEATRWFKLASQVSIHLDGSKIAESYYNLACAEAAIGKADDAIIHLGNALEVDQSLEKPKLAKQALVDPAFDPLRQYGRFMQLLSSYLEKQ